MSFGASPSDIIIVVTFCKALYRKCRDAGGEYDEISREVRGLHTVLRHLKYEVEDPDSPLNRDRSIWGRQLAPIIGDCDYTLRQLDGLLMKYGRLTSNGGGSSPSSPRILWDKVRFGSNEMDLLGGIRVKLISHKTSLTLFLDTVQLHQSGKVATTLDNHGGQLDVILDKVDNIAARLTQNSGSVMTSYDDDDKQVWKQFRRELIAEGFSSDVLQQHKDVLRAYIREIDQKGLLDAIPTDPQKPPPPAGANTARWVESVKSAPSLQSALSEDAPPSSASMTAASDDSGAKEMVIREENMKFPQSIKLERPKPETKKDGSSLKHLDNSNEDLPKERRRSDGSQRQSYPLTKLITSDEKEGYFLDTDGSSDEESETDDLTKGLKLPTNALIIRTSDLITLCQALQIRPAGSPTSFKSQGSFMDVEVVPRSMAYQPKRQLEYAASPTRPGAIPIPAPKENNASDRLGTSARPEPGRLAPDSQGNEIPDDAKWTRINRRLVSPEVLSQDHRRYEARPDFVAVLGVLSRAEIQSYAARSHELREARRHRHQHAQEPQPPPKPPRPIQRPQGGHDTPSEEEQDSSDSLQNHHRRPRYKENRSYPNYTHSTAGYPNPFGQAPPSPVWSPASVAAQPIWMPQPPPKGTQGGIWIPTSAQPGLAQVYYPPRGADLEPRRRHSSPVRSSRDRSDYREREKEKPKSRWKENLTAAGIGGAAVSLLNVLTEAAEAL